MYQKIRELDISLERSKSSSVFYLSGVFQARMNIRTSNTSSFEKKKIKHGVRAGSDTTEKLQTFYESPKTEICCEIPQMSVDMVHPMPSHATRARCNSTCLNDIGRRHPCIYAGEESLKAPGLWVYRLLGQGEVNHTSRTMAAIEELGNPRFSYAASRGFLDKTCLQLVLWNILITSSHICCIIFFFIR